MQSSLWSRCFCPRKFLRLSILLLVASLFVAAAVAQEPAAQSAAKGGTTTPPGAQYVGADTCKTCHEEIYTKHFEGTPHFTLTKGGAHGCEGCHGPGSAHVEGGGDVSKIISFKSLNAAASSKICLQCHSASKEHANFLRSPHLTNDVGCTACHSPHNAKIQRSLLKEGQPQLCYGCHTVQKAEFSRPFRHRVNEGLLVCSDCHNPHGGEIARQLRTSSNQDQVCFKCHTDTRGPFVYEHIPVKTEGCVACHMPHGSTNPRMLRVSNVNLLCLQCHTQALSNVPSQPPVGPVHNQSARFQACTMCHQFIHGSNFSEVFFKP